jgi:hypothetical protein
MSRLPTTIGKLYPDNPDFPCYFELGLRQLGLTDRLGIPKYSKDDPTKCAIPHKCRIVVFLSRTEGFSWDFDPAVGYRNARHAFESARYTSQKIEKAAQLSVVQFRVDENKRKEEADRARARARAQADGAQADGAQGDGAQGGAQFLLNNPESAQLTIADRPAASHRELVEALLYSEDEDEDDVEELSGQLTQWGRSMF